MRMHWQGGVRVYAARSRLHADKSECFELSCRLACRSIAPTNTRVLGGQVEIGHIVLCQADNRLKTKKGL